MAGDSVGKVQLDLELNKSQYERGLSDMESYTQKVTGKMGGMFKTLGKTIAAAFAVKAIINFGKECVNLGSDLAEVQNVVDATFTSLNEEVNKFAKNSLTQFGLSETMAKRYTGTMGAMAKAFGFSEKEALKMSIALTGLTGDVASFYNITQDAAYTKIKSVFTGETESLKELGIVMTQSALDAYALANGFGKTTAKMSEQEKVALRYKFVLQQLSTASGDFARTSDGWANQMRILSLQFDSLKASIGAGLINILLPVVKLLNTILGKLQTVADGFKKFTEMLTGKKADSSGMGEVNADLTNLASNADTASESVGGVGKAAEKAAKQAQKALAGFDEINKLSAPDTGDSTSSDAGGAGGSAFDFGSFDVGDTVQAETEKAVSALDKIKEKAKELKDIFIDGFKQGIGDDFTASLDRTKEHILNIGDSLKSIFTSPDILSSLDGLVNSIAEYLGKVSGSAASIGATLGELLFGGIDKYLTQNKDYITGTLSSIGDSLSGIYEKLGNFAVAFADVFEVFRGDTAKDVLANLIGIFSNTFLGIVDIALKFGEDILNCITQPFIDNKDKLKEAIENILKPLDTILSTLNESVKETFTALSEMYDAHLRPMFESFAEGFSSIFGKVLDGYNQYIAPVLQNLADKFKEVWEGKIQPMINTAIELIGKVGDFIKAVWEEKIRPFFEWIVDTIYPVIAPIIEDIGTLVMDVVGDIADILRGLMETLGGLIDFVIGIFTGDWEKAWSGLESIVDGFCTAVTGLWDGLMDIVGGIVETAFDALSGAWTLWVENIKRIWGNFTDGIQKGCKFITDGWEDLKKNGAEKWDAIMTKLSDVWGNIADKANERFEGILNKIGDVWDKTKTKTSEVWTGIKDSLGETLENIKTTFSNTFTSVKETVSTIFNGIWTVIKGVVNSILGGIENMANGVVTGVNTVIKALNGLSFDIPDWVPLLGGKTFGFDIKTLGNVHIPKLADGGYVRPNMPQLAIVGDNKQEGEIIAPESKIVESMLVALNKFRQQENMSSNSTTGDIILQFILPDGRMAEERRVRRDGKVTSPIYV